VGHGLEFARPFNIDTQTLLLLQGTDPGKLYYSSMALLGVRRDTTDDAADPRRGGLFSANLEAAPDFLGSSLQFVRAVAELRRYQALGTSNVVLAGRLKVGFIEPIQSTGQIPIYRRFFAGGTGSVRGYRFDYLGPRDAAGNPLGGDALVEGSLEARIPIYKDFRAVAFVDFGNVYLNTRVDLGQLKYASGVGLRYQTPVGPLGVDVGFPLNPIDPSRDKYRFHLTIGQAF
jgi:outer membrane translocation and assembly module TamA